MQFAARLAATLLALTWITPVAHAASVLGDFTLIGGTGHDPVPGSTPILDGARITWVGSRIPAGTVVDLEGKFVPRSLIDDHVHVGLVRDVTQDSKFHTHESVEQQLRIYAAHGVTAAQVLGSDQDTIVDIRADQGKAQPEMAETRRAVDQQVAKGDDFIKLWVDDEFGDLPSRVPAEIGKAIIDQAHEHKLCALAHLFYLDNAKTLVSQWVRA